MKNAAAASSARASAVPRRAAQYVPAAVPATTPNAVAPASRLRSAGSPRRMISATLFCGGAHWRPRSLCRNTRRSSSASCTGTERSSPANHAGRSTRIASHVSAVTPTTTATTPASRPARRAIEVPTSPMLRRRLAKTVGRHRPPQRGEQRPGERSLLGSDEEPEARVDRRAERPVADRAQAVAAGREQRVAEAVADRRVDAAQVRALGGDDALEAELVEPAERPLAQPARRVVGDERQRRGERDGGREGRARPPAQRHRPEVERAGGVTGVDHDRRFALAALDPVDELGRAVHPQLERPVADRAAHRAEQVGEDRVDEVLDDAEDERRRGGAVAAQARERAVVGGEHARELGGGALAVGGELDAAAAAGEQRRSELLLEQPHVAADGGLGEVHRFGGAVVAAEADDREERAEVGGIEVHRAIVAAGPPPRKNRSRIRIGCRTTSRLSAAAAAGTLGCVPDRVVLPAFVLLWSSGYVVGAVALGDADPLPLLAARFALASVVAVPLALRRGRWRGAPLGRLAGVGVVLPVVQFGCVYGGLALGVPAGLSALVILGLSPLLTTGLAVASVQEHSDARLWAGLAVGVAGVAISLAPELGTARVGAGVGLTLLGMIGLAGGTVLQKRWVGVADPQVSVAVQSVTAALALAPAAAIFGGRFDVSARLVLSLAWIAWGMGILSLNVFVWILRRHAASTAAALLLLVPPVTAIASVPALGEALHPASLLGMLVAMAGVAAVLRREAPSGEDGAGVRPANERRTSGRAGGRARPRPAD